MAIPASHIVSIMPRVITGGSNDLELNGLLLTDNDMISASTMVLSFPSAKDAGAYFGVNSVEYQAADVYFTGYINKFSAPRAFLVARRIADDAAAWLRGGRIQKTLAGFKTIMDGSLTISVDNTAQTIEDINLISVTSFSGIAAVIQSALTGVAVKYDGVTGAFTITSNTTGEMSEVSFASAGAEGTDLSLALNLTENTGAVISEGMNALSVDEQMTAIRSRTENWVSFATAWEEDIDAAAEWAAWVNKNYGWLYVGYTTEAATAVPDTSADMASVLKNNGYDHTAVVYGSLEYACFIMGTIASIAWQRTNGTITLAFKHQSGLTPWVANEMEAVTLEAKNCNYFGNFATRNAEFVFLYPGVLSASDYGFIDTYINSVWLNNRMQVALMDGITSAGKTPYTDRGYTMIRAWMMDPINEARVNRVIEAGVMLSERQKSEVNNEAGMDISNELLTQGYYIQILDPGASVRARRDSPVISLWYTYGGAVQKIEVASTAIL